MTRGGNEPADAIPALKMVRAALILFIEDGIAYLKRKEDYKPPRWAEDKKTARGQKAAFDDLCACGRMTKRLAHLNLLEPEVISYKFRRLVRRYYAERDKSVTYITKNSKQ